jgi:hypothetical protein
VSGAVTSGRRGTGVVTKRSERVMQWQQVNENENETHRSERVEQ